MEGMKMGKINLALPWDWSGIECPFCGETSDNPHYCTECGETF
jgi:primosomal protein N'